MPIEIVTSRPLNGETPLAALDEPITPVDDFYVRNNFEAPAIQPDGWRLRVGGLVARPLELTLDDVQSYPASTRNWTLECAGNGRRGFDPEVPGTPWNLGATGTAHFTGARLADVLDDARPSEAATTVVFAGADAGVIAGERVQFRRSLSREVALGDVMLAWAMNGEPLTRDHGAPLRLVVPRFYAVASVKWLVHVELRDRPFEGHFQTDRYRYLEPGREPVPVSTMRVRALVTSHRSGEAVAAGSVTIAGAAWSGAGAVRRVEVALGPGGAWQPARLRSQGVAGLAARWTADLDLRPGAHSVRVRATDEAGNVQPDRAPWNGLGYGNNSVQSIELIAR